MLVQVRPISFRFALLLFRLMSLAGHISLMNLIARNKPSQTLTYKPLLAAGTRTHTPSTLTHYKFCWLTRYIVCFESLWSPDVDKHSDLLTNKLCVPVSVCVCVRGCVHARHLFKFICFYFYIWLLNEQIPRTDHGSVESLFKHTFQFGIFVCFCLPAFPLQFNNLNFRQKPEVTNKIQCLTVYTVQN